MVYFNPISNSILDSIDSEHSINEYPTIDDSHDEYSLYPTIDSYSHLDWTSNNPLIQSINYIAYDMINR